MTREKKGTGFSLKDQLFNRDKVRYLANLFQTADNSFQTEAFVRDTMKRLTKLELKERITHIATILESYLSPDFRTAAKQIVAALPAPLDPTRTDDDFGDFIFAPLGEFVVRNGLAKQHLSLSLKTLKAITQRFSMEDAIRAFINQYPTETMTELTKWSVDGNYHVRRLVSEGTRPLLPWSSRLSIDATLPVPLLTTLHADPTRYVTRSVSNHLNDIAKQNPELVLTTLTAWTKQGQQKPAELSWMCRHSLRTLLKKGHAPALEFLGFNTQPAITVTELSMLSPSIRPGEAVEFSFTVTALCDQQLLIDFVIDFVKANGSRAPKVHKLKQISLKKGESTTITKRHVLRDGATTYTLYPGTHYVTLQINGVASGRLSFDLVTR